MWVSFCGRCGLLVFVGGVGYFLVGCVGYFFAGGVGYFFVLFLWVIGVDGGIHKYSMDLYILNE